MIKIAVIGIVAVLLAIPFKYIKGEYALYISLAGCIFIFCFIAQKILQLLGVVEQFAKYIPMESNCNCWETYYFGNEYAGASGNSGKHIRLMEKVVL